ncbi:MAG: hypothetical protein AVDCRST_MAG43-368 [uncultured Thermomicrobiales bacterium]|uniref:Uncharacterized protein n=1 Tax=uncultured Thermomicrobiales bacterium TaxID=1645740 RepID=A0A6J4U891_9BACT|nr:MAG: hypothetical protein AVDCRST_MAG43-368 [uncultured Thermomicrobiales bacterium]
MTMDSLRRRRFEGPRRSLIWTFCASTVFILMTTHPNVPSSRVRSSVPSSRQRFRNVRPFHGELSLFDNASDLHRVTMAWAGWKRGTFPAVTSLAIQVTTSCRYRAAVDIL